MATFIHDGVTLAYDDIQPAGGYDRTIVLLHGFSSNRHEGWRRTGWHAAFERRRMRCIAMDQRGHGESEKLHDAAQYSREAMAGDALALLDHLGVDRVDLCGFSMGSRTVLEAALVAPDRVSNLILCGVGDRSFDPRAEAEIEPDGMARAMLAEDPEVISDPMLRSFRYFADEQGEDRKALAACSAGRSEMITHAAMATLPMPVLVVAGQRDRLAGSPERLAEIFREGYGVTIMGCDHFSVITHALTKAAVFDFIDGMMDPNMPKGF